jgi:hypothetical protein
VGAKMIDMCEDFSRLTFENKPRPRSEELRQARATLGSRKSTESGPNICYECTSRDPGPRFQASSALHYFT